MHHDACQDRHPARLHGGRGAAVDAAVEKIITSIQSHHLPASLPVFLRRRLDVVRIAEHTAEIEYVTSQCVAYFYRNVHGPGVACYPRAADNMIYAWPCYQHECIGHCAVLAKGLIAPPSRVWIVHATEIISGTTRSGNEKGVCFPVVERYKCSFFCKVKIASSLFAICFGPRKDGAQLMHHVVSVLKGMRHLIRAGSVAVTHTCSDHCSNDYLLCFSIHSSQSKLSDFWSPFVVHL